MSFRLRAVTQIGELECDVVPSSTVKLDFHHNHITFLKLVFTDLHKVDADTAFCVAASGQFILFFFAEKSHMPNVFSSPPAVEETGGDSWKYSLRVSKDARNPHKQTHFFCCIKGPMLRNIIITKLYFFHLLDFSESAF